jgi:hypothetical protein
MKMKRENLLYPFVSTALISLVFILVTFSLGHGLAQASARMVLPPSISPVVILSGSDYQMGYQFGQQVGQYLEFKKDQEWVSALKKLGSHDKVIHALKGYQYYIKKYTPEQIEEMKGVAEGATAAGYKMSYTDILLLKSGIALTPTATYPSGAEKDKLPMEGCSNWSAWGSTTTDGSLICGDSGDTWFDYQVVVVAFPEHGNNYLAPTTVSAVVSTHPFMNNKGVFIGGSGGYALRDIDYDYALPRSSANQHIIRFAKTASEAKDMFLQWKAQASLNNHFADINGNAFVVETTAAIKSVRKPGDFGETDFLYATNNYFKNDMKEAIKGDKFIEHAGWMGTGHWSWSSIPRNLQLWNMLHNYRGKVNLEFAKMMWRFPGNPAPYPIDNKAYYSTRGKDWDQKICNLLNMRAVIMKPDNGDKGVAYICTGPAGRIAYPLFPGGEDHQIDGTNTFYQLSLASSPAALVAAAKNAAFDYISEAYSKFMMLNHNSAGYASLKEIYSKANAEYFEGINIYNKGLLASGNQAILYFAQAATAFTRSQAHAKQVYNAIVPPATSPNDLGLKPWFGDWGKWVTK